MIRRLLLLIPFYFIANVAFSQCNFDDYVHVNQSLVPVPMTVTTSGANDLGINPLTRICFELEHGWEGDLVLILESPAGLQYIIVGDNDNSSGGCGHNGYVYMDVCLELNDWFNFNPLQGDGTTGYDIPCNGDFCEGNFTVYCGGPGVIQNFFFPPTPNCDLNDFNVPGDPVNGDWTLLLGCVCGDAQSGLPFILHNWSLEFAEPCYTPFCAGDPVAGSMIPLPLPLEYCLTDDDYVPNTNWINWVNAVNDFDKYNYYLDENDKICSGIQAAKAEDFTPGTYAMRSFATDDELNFGDLNAFVGMTESEMFAFMNLACYSTVEGSLDFIINGYTDTISVDTMLCGEDLFWVNGESYFEGEYEVVYYDENSCDTLVYLNIERTPVDIFSLEIPVCGNDSIQLAWNAPAGTSFEWVSSNGFTSPLPDPVLPPVTNPDGEEYLLMLSGEEVCLDFYNLLLLPNLSGTTQAIDVTICAADTFFFNNNAYFETGSYADTFTSFNGCDSVVVTNLTVQSAIDTELHEFICAGDSYEFNGENLTVEGTYENNLTAANGCDSTVTLFLEIDPLATGALSANVCAGDDFVYYGQVFSETGEYEVTLITANGCDSLVSLSLEIEPPIISTLSANICEGEGYDFNGETLFETGEYEMTTLAANGCDSTVTLILEVETPVLTTINVDICENESYDFNGTMLSEAGLYTFGYEAANGCDSLVIISIDIQMATFTAINADICEGEMITIGNNVYSNSGTYLDTLINAAGCDSILQIEINTNNSVVNLTADLCAEDTLIISNSLYFETGNYVDTLQNYLGCDSIVHLDLTVWDALLMTDVTIVDANVNDEGGAIYPEFSTDSLLLTFLWSNGVTTPNLENVPSGEYQLTVTDANGCSYAYDFYVPIPLSNREEDLFSKIQLFPNPAQEVILVKNLRFKKANYRVFEISGKEVQRGIFSNDGIEVADLGSGLYFVEITADDQRYFGKFIKE